MNTLELTWNAYGHHNTLHVIDPDSTSVAAIANAGRALLAAHKAFREVDRERTAAQGDPERLAAEAKDAAREAARNGKAVKPKELRKKIAAAEERLADLDLEWEGAAAALTDLRLKYREAVAHHAPALAAEADGNIEAALMSLAAASATLRRAESALSGSLAIRAGVTATAAGGDFTPTPPRARSGGMGGAPGPYVAEALGNITTAIGYGAEIRDALRAEGNEPEPEDDDEESDDGE